MVLLEVFYKRASFDKAKTQLTFISDYSQHPFVKNKFSILIAIKTIRIHFNGILEHICAKLTYDILEGINFKVQTLKHIDKRFRYFDNFKKMSLLFSMLFNL